MTVTMSAKHQVTIPKKIANILGLKQGSIFNVEVRDNRIELIPLEIVEKEYPDEVYKKLDELCAKEKGREKRVTKKLIDSLKKGKV